MGVISILQISFIQEIFYMYTITALGHQLLLPIAENLWVFNFLFILCN